MPKIFKPPEARKSEGRIQKERDTLTPWLWISALQDFETVTFCWSRPQRVWSFIRQPYETNAGGGGSSLSLNPLHHPVLPQFLKFLWSRLRNFNYSQLFSGGGGLVAKSCPLFHSSMDCGSPGSSVHGISQAKLLEWVATSGDLSNQGIEPISPAWQVDSLPLSHQQSPQFWVTPSSVQSLSRVWLFVTPMDCSTSGFPVITNSQSLLKLMSIESAMPSSHLILCHPLLLLPSIFPSIRVFSNESVLCIRWPKYWNFSFSISPSNEYSGLISFRMDWLDLLAVQGTLKSLLRHHNSKS